MRADPPDHCDVAIVGGGPAGLAAATELVALGVRSVVVLEREPVAGGIPRHCGHYPFGVREFRRVLRGPDYAARLVARAEAAGVTIASETTVTALLPGPRLAVSTPGGVREIAARTVLLATGVREASRAARLIGGEKPGGVLSTGALQSLVYLKGLRPFGHPVILGTELVSFSALMTCRHLGIRPAAMIEPAARTTARWPSALVPALFGVPLHLDTELVAIHGESRVHEVVLCDRAGRERTLATDGVVVSGKFLPEASLVRASHLDLDAASGGPAIDQFGRCSDPAYFAAGNLLRAVETSGWSWAEGRRVARAVAAGLAGRLPDPGGGLPLAAEGEALKYVVPQRFVPAGPGDLAGGAFQLRVTRAVRGRLTLAAGGAEVWSDALDTLPERRILVPFSAVPGGTAAPLTFRIVEAPR